MITVVVWAALLSPLPSPWLGPHHLSLIISGMDNTVSSLPLINSSQSPALMIWGSLDGNRGWCRWEWCHSSFGGGGLVAKPCPTICDPMDYSPPGSSVPGISQARILEWVAISFSRGSSWPRDWTHVYVSCIGKQILYYWATRETRHLCHTLKPQWLLGVVFLDLPSGSCAITEEIQITAWAVSSQNT